MGDNWIWLVVLIVAVPIVAILVWGVLAISGAMPGMGRRSDLNEALAEAAETNRALLAKLEHIDSRLAAVEKTLNDIP
jgi:ABC-type uncharacterized transport system YnjBCD permease subunit